MQGVTGPAGHPVYRFWHGHLSLLLTELRPSLDAELVAHVLLSPLASDPLLQLLEKGEGERLAGTLRLMTTTLLDA
ncbi:hypothetical protein GCM10022221_31170 [Actinocorallia aurea]